MTSHVRWHSALESAEHDDSSREVAVNRDRWHSYAESANERTFAATATMSATRSAYVTRSELASAIVAPAAGPIRKPSPHARFRTPNTLECAMPAPSAPAAQSGNATAYCPAIGGVDIRKTAITTTAAANTTGSATRAAVASIDTTAMRIPPIRSKRRPTL